LNLSVDENKNGIFAILLKFSTMIKHFLITIYRNILRDKFFSLIN